MPRGRKKRVVLCQPPPKGHYMVDWTVNELIRRNALSAPAISLWLHLKGLAWARGECEPTDAMLAEWLGGVSTEMVRITRRELRSRHLLLEYAKAPAAGKAATRWLVPLPVLAGLRGNLPPEIAAAAAAEEARLKASLGEPEAQPHPGSNGNSPQAEFGANPICPNLVIVKEEEGRYPGDLYLAPPAPERVTAIARGNGEGGVGGGRIQPKPDLGPIDLGANPSGGENAELEAERAELTEFLVEHGAFASVAVNLVAWLLAHKTVEEAKIYALAHLLAVQDSADPRGKRLQGEQVTGRWVARLREHARPPEWALARAVRELADDDGADEELPDEEDPDEDPDDLPADGDADLVLEAAEPAPPLPTVVCRAGDHDCEVTVAELWQRTVGQLRYQLPGATWETWLRDTRGVDLAGEDLVVEVGSRYAEEWLRIRLRPLIIRTLRAIAGRELGVAFRVAEGAPA